MTDIRPARSPATTLAVITARSGSRDIPGKNIRPLGGRPLIEYTIEAASRCRRLTDTIVSTDSEEIADIARRAGATVPFLRPGHLAQDNTPHLPVIQHALTEMERLRDTQYDLVVTLQPTSPFRLPEDIDGTIGILLETGADSAVSVCEVAAAAHPIKAKRLDGSLLVPYCVPEPEGIRRQELPPAYKRSGAVYASRRTLVMGAGRFYGDRIAAYVVPRERSIDIDMPLDWIMAEFMVTQLRTNGFPF